MLSKSKKLFRLKSLIIDGQPVEDRNCWHDPIFAFFGGKWGCNRPQGRMDIMDFMMKWEATPVKIPVDILRDACASIRNTAKLDHHGISVEAIGLLVESCPSVAADFFLRLVSSSALTSQLEVRGRFFGK